MKFLAAFILVFIATYGMTALASAAVHYLRKRPTTDINRLAAWTEAVSGPPNPCLDGHTPLYISYANTHLGRICSVCTKELARPAWMDCRACAWFVIDGDLHAAHCPTHTPEPAA